MKIRSCRPLLPILGLCIAASLATAADARPRQRHGHHHRVVVRHPIGHHVRVLPHGHRIARVRGIPYHYHSGIFYRSGKLGFSVIAAPIGAVVAALPIGYVTLFVGGRPYYAYNGAYYVWDPGPPGYVVVEKPGEAIESKGVVAYPAEDQTPEQQAKDRYECHAWAVGESGFDPSHGLAGSDEERDHYDRAIRACLEGRGYSVQ